MSTEPPNRDNCPRLFGMIRRAINTGKEVSFITLIISDEANNFITKYRFNGSFAYRKEKIGEHYVWSDKNVYVMHAELKAYDDRGYLSYFAKQGTMVLKDNIWKGVLENIPDLARYQTTYPVEILFADLALQIQNGNFEEFD